MKKTKKRTNVNKLRNRRISRLNGGFSPHGWAVPGLPDSRALRAAAVGTVMLSTSVAGNLYALPTGGVVAGGAASITQPKANTMQITQATDKAIINWQGYSINVNELVKYLQPSAGSIALNRVLGGDPSTILGQLAANGRVFLINPNGILFGPTATVNVAGLLATTFDIKDSDFMSGKYAFNQDPGRLSSVVVNKGEIKVADNGFVFLVAPGVSNEGLIVANMGQVLLGAGNKLTVDFLGNGIINYVVEGKVADTVMGLDGQPITSAVSNTGTVKADGGQVLLTADASGALLSAVINQAGVIEAKSIVGQNGEIVLKGGSEGIVVNAGTLDVSGKEAGASGGNVKMTGAKVGHFGIIHADGMGSAFGGNVIIEASEIAALGTGSLITANAGTIGDGGRVTVFSPDVALFGQGALIEAKGGTVSGDGGYVEISGHGYVDIAGQVNTIAVNGKGGLFVIDPTNITISDNATSGNLTLSEGTWAQRTGQNTGNLNIGALNTSLGTTNITVTTNSTGTADGDITVNSASYTPITNAASGYGLTLEADRDINVYTPIELYSGAGGNGSITLDAGRNILVDNTRVTTTNLTGFGALSMNPAVNGDITVQSGDITFLAGQNITVQNSSVYSQASLVGNGNAGGHNVAVTSGNISFTAQGGNIEITSSQVYSQAQAYDFTNAETVAVTSGDVSFNAGGGILINGSYVGSDAYLGCLSYVDTASAASGDIAFTAAGEVDGFAQADGVTDGISVTDSQVSSYAEVWDVYGAPNVSATSGTVAFVAQNGGIEVRNSAVYAEAWVGCLGYFDNASAVNRTFFNDVDSIRFDASGSITIENSEVYAGAYLDGLWNFGYYGTSTIQATAGGVRLQAGDDLTITSGIDGESLGPECNGDGSQVYSRAKVKDLSNYRPDVEEFEQTITVNAFSGPVTLTAGGDVYIEGSKVYSRASVKDLEIYGCAGSNLTATVNATSGAVAVHADGDLEISGSEVYSKASVDVELDQDRYGIDGDFTANVTANATSGNVDVSAGGNATITDSDVYSEAYVDVDFSQYNDYNYYGYTFSSGNFTANLTANATSGNVSVSAGGDATITNSNVYSEAAVYGYLWQDGYSEESMTATLTANATSGNVTVSAGAGGDATIIDSDVYSGASVNGYVSQYGYYSESEGSMTANVTANAASGNVSVSAGAGGDATIIDSDVGSGASVYGYVEQEGYFNEGSMTATVTANATSGNVAVNAGGNVIISDSEVYSTADTMFDGWLDAYGYFDNLRVAMDGGTTDATANFISTASAGDVTINAGSNVTITDSMVYSVAFGDSLAEAWTEYGDATAQVSVSLTSGDVTIDAGEDISVTRSAISSSAGVDPSGMDGFMPKQAYGEWEDFLVAAYAYSDEGNTIATAVGQAVSGDVKLTAGRDITVEAGLIASFAGGWLSAYGYYDELRKQDISYMAGVGAQAYSDWGNSSADVSVISRSGAVTLDAGRDVNLYQAAVTSAAISFGASAAELGYYGYMNGTRVGQQLRPAGEPEFAATAEITTEATTKDVTITARTGDITIENGGVGTIAFAFGIPTDDFEGSMPGTLDVGGTSFAGQFTATSTAGKVSLSAGGSILLADAVVGSSAGLGFLELYGDLPEFGPRALQDGGTYSITGTETVTSGDVTLTAGGDITFENAFVATAALAVTNLMGYMDGMRALDETIVLNATENPGDVIINASGTVLLGTAAAPGGSVSITAGGSILDNNDVVDDGDGEVINVIAGANSTLQAGGVVGTDADPIEVDVVGGMLSVRARHSQGGISVDINGTVAPSNTLQVLGRPPGDVIFNGKKVRKGQTETIQEYEYVFGTDLQFDKSFQFSLFKDWLLHLLNDVDLFKPIQ
jgi:filamentous hemagglutinin family protein